VNRPDRGLTETLSWATSAAGEEHPPLSPEDRAELIADLMALVDAIGQRVPHIERVGERRIALDAAELKSRALERLEGLRAGRD
jgi:hypothetical protein